MEWNSFKEGSKYIIRPIKNDIIKFDKLKAAFDKSTVVLVDRQHEPPRHPDDFHYRVRLADRQSDEIWVPGTWLHPVSKVKDNKCTCTIHVIWNRGCKCKLT